MKKLLSLLGVGALVVMWSGCGITDPISAPRVTIDAIGAISAGAYKNVTGKVEADTEISACTYSIDPVTTGITVSGPSVTGKKSFTFDANNPIKITVASGVADGSYNLKISVTAGASTDVSFPFTTTGGGSTGDLTEATATLGNTGNAEAGTIDLDNGSKSQSTDVTAANVGSVDLTYAFSTSATMGGDRFYVPKAAKYGTTDDETIKTAAAGFDYTDTWPTDGYSDVVRIVRITAAQYDATTTKSAATSLFGIGTPKVFVTVADGDAFVVKTSSGAYALVKVTGIVAGVSGTVTFKYAK